MAATQSLWPTVTERLRARVCGMFRVVLHHVLCGHTLGEHLSKPWLLPQAFGSLLISQDSSLPQPPHFLVVIQSG